MRELAAQRARAAAFSSAMNRHSGGGGVRFSCFFVFFFHLHIERVPKVASDHHARHKHADRFEEGLE